MSWLSSTATLVILSSVIVPKGFVEIADWLAPSLGPTFRPELYLVFLTFGPSLSYIPLLITWVVAGVVGGFFARSVLRSMAGGTISTLAIILLMVGNGFVLFTGFRNQTGGFSGLSIPPPPPGLSLADILNAPMVAQGIQAVSSGGGINPFSVLKILVVNFILNIAIFGVAFIVSGSVFSKIFHTGRPKVQPVTSYQVQNAPGPKDPTPLPPTAIVVGVLAIVLLLVSSLILPAGFAQGTGSSGQPTGEQLTLNLQKDGTLKMLYSTNVSSLPGVSSNYQRDEFQGLAGGFLFAFNGSIDLGQDGSGSSSGPLSTLTSLLPQNGFLAVYGVPDSSTGKARADLLASEFGQGFGVNLSYLVGMSLPSFGGQQVPGGAIYIGIYSGDGQAGTVGARILSLVQGTGVGSLLTPQKVLVGHFGVLGGFVNLDFQNATTTPNLTPAVQVMADLTPLGNFYGRGNFTLGLRQVLGNQGTISPSTIAKTTSIQLGFPANSNVTGYWPSNASIDTAQGQLTYSMNATSTQVSNVYVNFTSTFPQRMEISRGLDPQSPFSSGTMVTEKITVTNLGNETIHGVMTSETRLFEAYPTLHLLSPSQNMTLGDIPPQGSASATLQFRVTSDGFYTLPPTDITYTDQGQAISKPGNPAYIQSSFSISLYLQALVRGTAPYSYLFLLLIVLPPILQIPRFLRRSRPERRQQVRAIASEKSTRSTEW